MKRLKTTVTLVLIGMLATFFVEQVKAQPNRVINLNDSTLIVAHNNTIARAGVEDWAAIATERSLLELSNSEIIELFQTRKVTQKGSWTHRIEKELLPVLRGNEMDVFTHWEITNGFLETRNEDVITAKNQVNKPGTIAFWLGLLSGALMIFFLLIPPRQEVSGYKIRRIYASVSLTHITSLAGLAGLGRLYEVFPSQLMSIGITLGFLGMMFVSSLPIVSASDKLKRGAGLVVTSLGLFTFLGLVILAVPGKLSLAVLVLAGLLFFAGYLVTEAVIAFTPEEREKALAETH
ncbi:MAG: hypothetical protein WD335_00250 [Candidatus Paceibacterota bacterium]